MRLLQGATLLSTILSSDKTGPHSEAAECTVSCTFSRSPQQLQSLLKEKEEVHHVMVGGVLIVSECGLEVGGAGELR